MSGTQHQPPEGNERRLAAIVFTDVVGYSARMQRDETGTLTLVRADFERMRTLCAQHGGEVLKSTGDGLLLCFSSVVQAVACALVIQGEFGRRGAEALQHRIGIHLGDVFREGGDVAGDGVNIAARLQTKARPGTICLSQSVYDAVKGKVPMHVEPLGPQQFKNITEAIRVYLIVTDGAEMPVSAKRTRWPVAVAVILAGLAVFFWFKSKSVTPAANPPALAEVGARDDRSIAVLPFTNMSDDKDNAYFADGVHEDILTDLANISALKVISRTSVMQYRGTTKTVRQIAAELGVAYVLEGSVRRAGDKVRVTGQLINAVTDEHVWAQAYDGDLTDVFALQSKLAHEIAAALQVLLSPHENARLEQRPTQSLAAYDLFQQAMAIVRKGVPQASLDEALPLFEHAVQLDPGYAKAWAQLCQIYMAAYWREDRSSSRLASARQALARGEEADPGDCDVLGAGAGLGRLLGDQPMLARYRQKIIEFYPNRPEAYQVSSEIAFDEQRWSEALTAAEKAQVLDPFNKGVLNNLERVLRTGRRFARAEEVVRALVQLDPADLDAALRLACMPFFARGSIHELLALQDRLTDDLERKDPATRNIRIEIMVMLGDGDGLIRLWRKSAGDIKFFRDYSKRNARMLVASAYLARKDTDSARPLLEQNRDEAQQEIAVNPHSAAAFNDLGLALSMLGEQAAGRAALARARDIQDRNPNDFIQWQNVINRAWAGEESEAIAGLRQILRSPQMAHLQTNVYRLRLAPLTLPLHGNPDFESMLEEPANNAPFF